MSSTADEFRIFTISNVPTLNSVRLYDSTLEAIARKHREVVEFGSEADDAIAQGLASVTKVHQSETNSDSLVLVSGGTTHQGNPLRIIVKRVPDAESASARVQTAYFSGNEYPGTLLWSTDHE